MGLKHISRRDIDSNPLYYRGTSGRHVYDFSSLPSLDKGKHACQRVFPALFVLFALAGASPPASQKPKITRKYIAGGCGAVLPEQKCVQKRKGPQRILAVLSRGLTQYGRISAPSKPYLPLSSDGTFVSLQLLRQKKRRDPNVRTAPERAYCKVGPTRALGRKAE